MWTRCGYQMFHVPLPPVHFNPIIDSAAPPPFPRTRDRGVRRSGHVQSSDIQAGPSGGQPPHPLVSSGFPYKQLFYYCIFSSTCGALEVLTFHSSSGCSAAFFPCITRFYVRIYHF